MHWVIQQGLYSTDDQCALIRSLDRCGVLYDVVSVDKRSVKMVPDVNPSGLVMVCGTYSLSRIAVERLWRPGTFLNGNHNHRAWVSAWGSLMLNADALSTFRIGRNVVASPDVDPAALEFGRAAVAAWQPARGFALDVALTAGGYRIVEVNCLNMSRFYGADIQRIVAAIETMVFDA